MSKLKVGQTLWYVPNLSYRNNAPRCITVVRVGRRWATCRDGQREIRVEMGTFRVDGGGASAPGYCYLSEDDYVEQQKRESYWREIRQITNSWIQSIPHNLTSADLREIAAKLRGEEPVA